MQVIEDFIEWAKLHYEDPSISKLVPQRGKVFDYLRNTIDHTKPGKATLHMKPHVENILKEFPHMEKANELKLVKTSAAEHLFEVTDKAEKVDDKKK